LEKKESFQMIWDDSAFISHNVSPRMLQGHKYKIKIIIHAI